MEIAADTSPRVVSSYVWNLDPQVTAILPPEQRMTRVALEALGRRYFHTLSTHVPIAEDYDEAACNRFHSGQQIANVARDLGRAMSKDCESPARRRPTVLAG